MNNLFKPKQQSDSSSARGSLSGFMNKVKAKVTTQKEQVEIAQAAVQQQQKVKKLEKSPDYKFKIDDDDDYDDEEDGSPVQEKPEAAVQKTESGEMMSDSSSEDDTESSGDGQGGEPEKAKVTMKENSPEQVVEERKVSKETGEEESSEENTESSQDEQEQTNEKEEDSAQEEAEEEYESEEDEEDESISDAVVHQRPKLNNCINKLPKVGQCVNLNSFECFIAVKKVPKPILLQNNCEFSIKGDEKLTINESELQIEAGYMSARVSSNHQQLDKSSPSQSAKSGNPYNTDLSLNSTRSSQSSSDNSSKSTKVQNSFMQKQMFSGFVSKMSKVLKRTKDSETQTSVKCKLRYIAVEQGRLLVLKSLIDKIDGDKYSQVRQYPESFLRSGNDKGYQLPTLTWNARIVRVYRLNHLNSISIENLDALAGFQDAHKKLEQDFLIKTQFRQLFANKSENTVDIKLNWTPLPALFGASSASTQFQKPQMNTALYLEQISESYTPEELLDLGFNPRTRSLDCIDNTFKIRAKDLYDLFNEIDMEKRRAYFQEHNITLPLIVPK